MAETVRTSEKVRQAASDEKRFLTVRISETARTLSFGILALYYGLVSSDGGYTRNRLALHPTSIKIMASAATVALLMDYLQYLFGRASVMRALARKDEPGVYDDAWPEYILRGAAFWTKQAFTMVAVLSAIWTIAAPDST